MESLNDRLEAFLKARPNIWIDGRTIATIAGSYGWRTRLSELRRQRGMTIQNRVVTYRKERTNERLKSSLYRYVPAEDAVAVRVDPQTGQQAFL